MNKILSAAFACAILCACTKDRDFSSEVAGPTGTDTSAGNAHLKINEIVAKGSLLASELGNTSDWIELYNQSTSSFQVVEGEWFISDDPTNPEKYQLPSFTISAGGFKVLFCDDSNRVVNQIHTNFGLSSAGETVLLSRKVNGNISVQDSFTFGIQTSDNMSEARIPDGSSQWNYPTNPTPGTSNQ